MSLSSRAGFVQACLCLSLSTQASWLLSKDLTALTNDAIPFLAFRAESGRKARRPSLAGSLDVLRGPQAWFQSEDALTLPDYLVPAWGSQSHDFKHSLPLDIYLSILSIKAEEVCAFSLLALALGSEAPVMRTCPSPGLKLL